LIKACSIHTYHINALIHEKQFHLHNLQNHVFFYRIEKQLQNSILQKKITNLQIRLNNKSVRTYLMLSGKENNTLLIFHMKILFQKNKHICLGELACLVHGNKKPHFPTKSFSKQQIPFFFHIKRINQILECVIITLSTSQ